MIHHHRRGVSIDSYLPSNLPPIWGAGLGISHVRDTAPSSEAPDTPNGGISLGSHIVGGQPMSCLDTFSDSSSFPSISSPPSSEKCEGHIDGLPSSDLKCNTGLLALFRMSNDESSPSSLSSKSTASFASQNDSNFTHLPNEVPTFLSLLQNKLSQDEKIFLAQSPLGEKIFSHIKKRQERQDEFNEIMISYQKKQDRINELMISLEENRNRPCGPERDKIYEYLCYQINNLDEFQNDTYRIPMESSLPYTTHLPDPEFFNPGTGHEQAFLLDHFENAESGLEDNCNESNLYYFDDSEELEEEDEQLELDEHHINSFTSTTVTIPVANVEVSDDILLPPAEEAAPLDHTDPIAGGEESIVTAQVSDNMVCVVDQIDHQDGSNHLSLQQAKSYLLNLSKSLKPVPIPVIPPSPLPVSPDQVPTSCPNLLEYPPLSVPIVSLQNHPSSPSIPDHSPPENTISDPDPDPGDHNDSVNCCDWGPEKYPSHDPGPPQPPDGDMNDNDGNNDLPPSRSSNHAPDTLSPLDSGIGIEISLPKIFKINLTAHFGNLIGIKLLLMCPGNKALNWFNYFQCLGIRPPIKLPGLVSFSGDVNSFNNPPHNPPPPEPDDTCHHHLIASEKKLIFKMNWVQSSGLFLGVCHHFGKLIKKSSNG